jgi:hypothetical protein
VSAHLAAQRAVVRMLFDPAFADAARADPERVLAALDPALRAQLAAVDPRAFRLDPLRRRRALRTLSDEFKATTTLVLAETRSLAFLEQFFASSSFHACVEERGSMPLAFAAWLAGAVSEGRLTTPVLPEVLVLETALARARRAAADAAPAAESGSELSANVRVALAPGVFPVEVAAGALAALQQCERYLFEVSLMPAVALCDDAPRLLLEPPRPSPSPGGARKGDALAADPARLHLVTVPTGGGNVSLVTVDDELHRVLRAFDGSARTVASLLGEASARGVPPLRTGEILRGLLADEIACAVKA